MTLAAWLGGGAKSAATVPSHRADAPSEGQRWSRGVLAGIGGALVLVVAGVGLLVVVPRDGEGRPDQAVAAESGTDTTQPQPSAPGPTTGTTGPTTGTFNATGQVHSRLTGQGVVITDQLLQAAEDISVVYLSVRTLDGEGSLAFTPSINQLRMTVRGRRVSQAPVRLSPGEVAVVQLRQPADTVRVRFHARGQVKTPDPSVPGRALVLLNGLDMSPSQSAIPQVVRLFDPGVLNLACVIADATPIPCGETDRRSWFVDLPGGAAGDVAVVAQVDTADRSG